LAVVLSGCDGGQKEAEAATALHERAEGLYADGAYEEATRLYEKLLSEYPEWSAEAKVAAARDRAQAKANFKAARKAARGGRQEEAGELLSEALALAPEDAEINYGVGWVYIEMALEYQAKARATSSAAKLDYAMLAESHAELARERFARSIKLNAEHWAGYRGLAIYHLYATEYDEALKNLTEAEKFSKTADEKMAVRRLRLQVYLGQEKNEEAKAVVDELVQEYAERGEAYSALAEYYIGQYYVTGDKANLDEAIAALEKGVTQKFEDEESRNRTYVMLSRLKLSRGDYNGAVSAAKSALEGDPFNERYTDEYTVAWGAKRVADKGK
jgi:tetratricopeptide (TPR) repeat protein